MRNINSALKHEIFNKPAYGVVRECSNGGSSHSKAAPKPAHDIVFAAAFPCFKIARSMDAAIAGIEAEHDFTEGNCVPTA